jgi:hypothetical protein
MKNCRFVVSSVLCAILVVGAIGCTTRYHSSFADQSVKPVDLVKLKYRMLKAGAMGESYGFKFIWIPFASPTDGAAKRDMLDRLKKEGIDTTGKNIAFTNATADKGGFGFIGLIGAPTITLTADVIEILGEQPPQELDPSAQPAP